MKFKGRITSLQTLLDCLMEIETAGLDNDEKFIWKEIVRLFENGRSDGPVGE